MVDDEWRDFHAMWEICKHVPRVCCMTATLQSIHVKKLAAQLGRTTVTESMLLPPFRSELTMSLKVVADPRTFILDMLGQG